MPSNKSRTSAEHLSLLSSHLLEMARTSRLTRQTPPPEYFEQIAKRALARKKRAQFNQKVRVREKDQRRRARVIAQRCSCCTDADLREVFIRAVVEEGHVDHIKPLVLGGAHCVSNLQILSPEAHRVKTAAEQREFGWLY